MTMPHLQNCDHSDSGWCLDCVKKLNDRWEEKVSEVASCRFQHSDAECKAVGELLKYLQDWPNTADCHDFVLDGKLEVYWVDSVMGTIEGDTQNGFSYYPLAFGQRGQNERHGKNI